MKSRAELQEVQNQVWNTGEIPDEWREGIVKLILKRGNRHEVKNYRGLTMMDTRYKIYTEILRKRKIPRNIPRRRKEAR